ncbi:helix-turn-helix domain-containing protein [Nocardia sp. BMG51109]|uniref:helix-turn-helix domain-containing protein n=1 Tax=Nocardia sp. BMG51109 TaxID=1056816 RepID=UPI0018DE956D|nr:helix-turn-helix domain-containing protein [Nocardia sp. BMG51109]
MLEASAPAQIILHDRNRAVHGRIEGWQFGATGLVRVRTAGFCVVRTPRQIRQSPASSLQISLSRNSIVRRTQGNIRSELRPQQTHITDYNQPFEVDWCGGEGIALGIPLQDLGVPAETLRRADHLQASPFHSLIANQLLLMADAAEVLVADPAATDLGAACVEMVRALLISAAGGHGDGTALPADIMITQIRHYIQQHLTDPDLAPASIARAHHISIRYLYKLCARANFSLHRWIIAQRLERVRRDLADPKNRHRTIAVIAQQYSFRDPSHFTRRFRAAYGMTPREWRDTALTHRPS